MTRHAAVLAPLALVLVACVPEAKYNAALKDAETARADLAKCTTTRDQAKEQADAELTRLRADIERLKGDLATAEGKATSDEDRARLEELKKAKAVAEAHAKLVEDFLRKLKGMIDAGKLKIITRHGRLVLQLHNDVLFDPAKTELKPAGVQALKEIAVVLKTIGGRKFQVAGHTDAYPIKTEKFPSNWELSAARAMEVVKVLLGEGVAPQSLSVAGYGQYDPLSGNAALNRRTEITLVPNVEELYRMPELK